MLSRRSMLAATAAALADQRDGRSDRR